MVKFILLPVFCVLLVAKTGSCQDRITISQLLSFVDKIAVDLKQIRDSIPAPNNLQTFIFQNTYETPRVRALFETLPPSIQSIIVPSTRVMPSASLNTKLPTATPEPASSSSTNPISLTIPAKIEGSIQKTVDKETIIDEFRFDTAKIAAWFRETEHAARHKSKFHVSRSTSDQDKIIEVLNDFTALANRWGLGFTLYKYKLEIYDSILVSDFASNALELLIASLVGAPVQVAKPFIIAETNEIIAKAQAYRAQITDNQTRATMDKIISLLQAVTNVPDLLIKSLTG